MHNKIKKVREYLELSETQFARLLNVSSYKYKNYENGMLEISTELLILISLAFGISIDFLVFDKYCVDDILGDDKLQEIKCAELTQRVGLIRNRICSLSPYKNQNVNYRVVHNIIKKFMKAFKSNLYDLRLSRAMEVSEITKKLSLSKEDYLQYEGGIKFPPITIMIDIVELFDVSIDELMK